MRPPDLQLSISHKARSVPYDRVPLERLAADALPRCLALAKENNAVLASLDTVEISILGTRAMAKVHRDFLNIPGPTDVITFPYGEILVCAPVAAARAPEFSHTTTEELALYIIHGLLHLSGFDDLSDSDAQKMATMQTAILENIVCRTR